MILQVNSELILSMQQNKIILKIPKKQLTAKIEGLCGNNDGDVENDYETSDGMILPYITTIGFKRSASLGFL